MAERGEVVLSVDEMTGIQALERIFPDRPVIPGSAHKMEFEYKRNGTQTLIAARDVCTGIVFGRCGPTRTEKDFANFIKNLARLHSEASKIHIVCDNLNVHLSESLVRYIARLSGDRRDLGKKGRRGILNSKKSRQEFLCNPDHKIVFHFTPKHASWMNQIEIWFSILARKTLKRGNFSSKTNLKKTILAFIDYYNATMARPFKWTYLGKVLVGA